MDDPPRGRSDGESNACLWLDDGCVSANKMRM
jgi:hypothetical protein